MGLSSNGGILPIFMIYGFSLMSKARSKFHYQRRKGKPMIKFSMDPRFGRSEYARQLIAGYVRLLQQRVNNDGWNPYFLTFMFRHLPGKKSMQLAAIVGLVIVDCASDRLAGCSEDLHDGLRPDFAVRNADCHHHPASNTRNRSAATFRAFSIYPFSASRFKIASGAMQ
jgi:hypothetical protein